MFESNFLSTLPRGSGGPWPPVAIRFALLLDALVETACPIIMHDRTMPGISVRLWMALQRLLLRFAGTAIWALARTANKATAPATARAAAQPRPWRPRRSRDPFVPPGGAWRRAPRRRLPTAFAWLRRQVPAASGHAVALAAFLAEPETVALLARSASLTRQVASFCRMLGIPAPPPPSPAPPRAVRPVTPPAAVSIAAPPDAPLPAPPPAPPPAPLQRPVPDWASPAASPQPEPGAARQPPLPKNPA